MSKELNMFNTCHSNTGAHVQVPSFTFAILAPTSTHSTGVARAKCRDALKLCLAYNASMEQRWLQVASSDEILETEEAMIGGLVGACSAPGSVV